jgi:hypothetical protein
LPAQPQPQPKLQQSLQPVIQKAANPKPIVPLVPKKPANPAAPKAKPAAKDEPAGAPQDAAPVGYSDNNAQKSETPPEAIQSEASYG